MSDPRFIWPSRNDFVDSGEVSAHGLFLKGIDHESDASDEESELLADIAGFISDFEAAFDVIEGKWLIKSGSAFGEDAERIRCIIPTAGNLEGLISFVCSFSSAFGFTAQEIDSSAERKDFGEFYEITLFTTNIECFFGVAEGVDEGTFFAGVVEEFSESIICVTDEGIVVERLSHFNGIEEDFAGSGEFALNA